MFTRKVKHVEWSDFFVKEQRESICLIIDSRKIPAHFKKHGIKYVVAGLLTFVLFIPNEVNAIEAMAGGTGDLDKGARKIYEKLISVAKWVIIGKGGMDIIQGVASGDVPEVKKKFMGYLLVYALLFALPWGMDEIEKLFGDMETTVPQVNQSPQLQPIYQDVIIQ